MYCFWLFQRFEAGRQDSDGGEVLRAQDHWHKEMEVGTWGMHEAKVEE